MLSLALAACTSGSALQTARALGDRTVGEPSATALALLANAPARTRRADSLLALDAEAVRAMIGEPEFVWTEQGAAMWRYRGEACFVDVFLYEGAGVTYVDVRGEGLDEGARDACFLGLLAARAAS